MIGPPGGRVLALVLLFALAACSRAPRRGAAPAPRPPAASSTAGSAGRISADDAVRLRARGLAVPVLGVYPDQVPDSYNAGRSGGRTHNAVDILAPRGTPVLAADDGEVARLGRNALGGITVYAVDTGRHFVYYYAHLDRYRVGLAEGMRLAKGDVIGYVGTTGNAPPDAPHLHFQVMRIGEGRQWWAGVPLDPRPYFVTGGIER